MHTDNKKKRQREEKDNPVCIEEIGKGAQIRGKASYIQRDPQLNFSKITGHYAKEWDTYIAILRLCAAATYIKSGSINT